MRRHLPVSRFRIVLALALAVTGVGLAAVWSNGLRSEDPPGIRLYVSLSERGPAGRRLGEA
jgi:hypothetical protein